MRGQPLPQTHCSAKLRMSTPDTLRHVRKKAWVERALPGSSPVMADRNTFGMTRDRPSDVPVLPSRRSRMCSTSADLRLTNGSVVASGGRRLPGTHIGSWLPSSMRAHLSASDLSRNRCSLLPSSRRRNSAAMYSDRPLMSHVSDHVLGMMLTPTHW